MTQGVCVCVVKKGSSEVEYFEEHDKGWAGTLKNYDYLLLLPLNKGCDSQLRYNTTIDKTMVTSISVGSAR